MIMSRLLTPAETGVFAVAAVFAAFASTFRDFGVAEYLIQERDLRDEHIRAALTVNIFVSWAMSILLFFAAPYAADFYRTPGVADVMRIQSINFILIPFGAVTMAFFRRQLDFRPVFIANQASNITVFIVAIACAMNGLSFMSLAWSSLAGVIVTVCISIYFRPPGFPRWPGIRGIRRVVDFGKFASGVYIFGQIGRGAPEMIIGRVQDMASVALFSRGGGIVELFNKTVIRGVLPVCLRIFPGATGKVARLRALPPKHLLSDRDRLAAIRLRVGNGLFSNTDHLRHPMDAAVPLTKILCLVGGIELISLPLQRSVDGC
jgi:O-antigen/teichoic acid export membrane protein